MNRRTFLKIVGVIIAAIIGLYFLIKELFTKPAVKPAKQPKKTAKVITPTSSTSSIPESGVINLTPSGGDDTDQIQKALTSGNTLNFTGRFKCGSIKLVSNIIWNAKGAIFDNIDITNSGTISNVTMDGGTYNNDGTVSRIIELIVINSKFSNIIINNTGSTTEKDCACHGFGLVGAYNSSNNSYGNTINNITCNNCAIADKNQDDTRGNTWVDCIYNGPSGGVDGFIIKCKNSTFTRCIAKNSNTAGFGLYAKDDDSNTGIEISNNKFYDCEAHNNNNGFTYTISSTTNSSANIHDNFIQGITTGNAESGLGFGNKMKGTLSNNTFDIISYNNNIGINIGPDCNNNTGNCVVYSNNQYDIQNLGSDNKINAYVPAGKSAPNIFGSKISSVNFDCSNIPNLYCTKKFCVE